jgi:hypothetical protein
MKIVKVSKRKDTDKLNELETRIKRLEEKSKA